MNFADKLIEQIKKKQSPICIGLDTQLDLIPDFIKDTTCKEFGKTPEAAAHSILEFNKGIIGAVADIVPAVKPQSAFFEQYGHHGWWALEETIKYAQSKGLLVILDAKRNDISSTAEAYSTATIGEINIFEKKQSVLGADAVTVTPYLGSDGIMPFIDDCKKYDKGIFILVKTSNKSSGEMQDIKTADQIPFYEHVAQLVHEWGKGKDLVGSSKYSSVGAVVGATYPEVAKRLRKIMPRSIFLVPGYGTQGATAVDVKPCFNEDVAGAIISSSRSIIYAYKKSKKPAESYTDAARNAANAMIADILRSLEN